MNNIMYSMMSNAYLIIFCCLILFFIVMIICRSGKKGTWNTPKQNEIVLSVQNYDHKKYNVSNKNNKSSKGEQICRQTMERIFGVEFPNVRPNFLKNNVTSKTNLELDCYNDDLKIAVEYNGRQHYKFIPYFHKTMDGFKNQKFRDYLKKDLCKKNNVTLISVPYTIPHDKIPQFIIDNLQMRRLLNHKKGKKRFFKFNL